jgi:hypothetical protein
LQNGGEFRPGFVVQRINPWTGSTHPWTDGDADRGGQQREERTGSSARASPGLKRRRGGRETAVKARWCRCSVRGLLRRGERRKEARRGAVKLDGGAHLL